jgi:hypothetical protein
VSNLRTSMGRARRLGWMLAPVALAAALTGVVGASSAGAAPPVATPNDEGTFAISHITALAPGASVSKTWNNTPAGRSYFVDVRPVTNTSTVPSSCAMEVTRQWRVQNATIVSGAVKLELEVHATVQNIGSSTCDADVYLGWVTPSA